MLLAATVLLGLAALAVAERHLKGPLLRAIAARTGREIHLDTLEARLLSLHPTLTATELQVGNPPWMPAGDTAHVGKVTLRLRWRFALPPLRIRRLELEGTRLYLRRDLAGRANWQAAADGPGAGPPLIQSLSMPGAQVVLADERRHLKFRGTVSAADAVGSDGLPPLRIEGAGELNGRAATFVVEGDPLLQVRKERPYAFTFKEQSGATHLSGHGALEQPFDFRRVHAELAARGPDLKDLYYLLGLRLIDTGAFQASAKLIRTGKRFEYRDLKATSGSSDVSGALSVDSTGARPRIEGQLESRRLRFADLGARAAGRAPEAAEGPALRVPATPFRLTGLRRSDAAVKVRLHALEIGPQTLQAVSAVVTADKGVLSIEKLKGSLGGGTVSGDARLEARHQTPRGELNLVLADLPLEQLRGPEGGPAALRGPLSARLQLTGSGDSWHALAASANGTATAVIPHGAVRAAAADAASLDLSGALGLLLKSDKETPIHCAVAGLEAHEGVLSLRSFAIDTDRSLITGGGEIHMDTEALDLRLQGRPKKAQLALHSALAIRGTLSHPQFRLAGRGAATQLVAATALGVVLTPIAAVLAFVNPGLQRDADCAALLAQGAGIGRAESAPR